MTVDLRALDRRGYLVQRACAWTGIAFITLMAIGFVGIAQFVPPPHPGDSPAETATYFLEDINRVRLGLIISAFAAGLLVPLSSVIAFQMRRTEGRFPLLSMIQFGSGVLLSLEFLYLIFFWQVAAFRQDRALETIELLNDMAWIPYIGLSCTVFMQALSIGLAVLLDPSTKPVFPRWFGWYQVWAALLFLPGTFNVFFHDGPLAWDGLIAFWMPIPVYVSWTIITPIMVLKAIRGQQDADAAGTGEPDVAGLAEEVARLRAEVEASRAARA